MLASRIESAYVPTQIGIESAKISKKTPSPMVICLALFAIAGKFEKGTIEWLLVRHEQDIAHLLLTVTLSSGERLPPARPVFFLGPLQPLDLRTPVSPAV